MSTPISAPVDVLTPGPSNPVNASAGKTREQIKTAAQDFEASFLSIMLGQMMTGVGEGKFSGGEGEQMFKSFMTDAMAKSMTRHGGIGLAPHVQNEMLKLQGLSK